eukprot:COSAG01_NODE_3553_length_5934_cov_4.175282_6_plen_261_part_00
MRRRTARNQGSAENVLCHSVSRRRAWPRAFRTGPPARERGARGLCRWQSQAAGRGEQIVDQNRSFFRSGRSSEYTRCSWRGGEEIGRLLYEAEPQHTVTTVRFPQYGTWATVGTAVRATIPDHCAAAALCGNVGSGGSFRVESWESTTIGLTSDMQLCTRTSLQGHLKKRVLSLHKVLGKVVAAVEAVTPLFTTKVLTAFLTAHGNQPAARTSTAAVVAAARPLISLLISGGGLFAILGHLALSRPTRQFLERMRKVLIL